jgi:hypothetical protein
MYARTVMEPEMEELDDDGKLVVKVHGRLVALGFGNPPLNAWNVRCMLFGGPSIPNPLEEQLVKYGYNPNAESYEQNLFFWTAVGVSEEEFDKIIIEGG